jgi:hypothetical protein
MVVVVAQPTANANRAVTLIMLNEFRICFMILGSFQIALFLICHRRALASTYATHSPLDPSELMPSNTHFDRARLAEQLDFGRTRPCPMVL